MFAGRQYDTLYLTDRFCKAFYTSSIWNKLRTPVNTEQVIQLTKTDILSVEDTTWQQAMYVAEDDVLDALVPSTDHQRGSGTLCAEQEIS